MAECGADGWSLWNGDVIDMVDRPASLAGVANAYGVYVVGGSMEPRYFPGELVLIHPGKPVTLGAFVLVQRKPKQDGDPPLAVIKRLIKRTASKITLEQFNPAKSFDIRSDDIVSVHRVVGASEGVKPPLSFPTAEPRPAWRGEGDQVARSARSQYHSGRNCASRSAYSFQASRSTLICFSSDYRRAVDTMDFVPNQNVHAVAPRESRHGFFAMRLYARSGQGRWSRRHSVALWRLARI